MELNDAISRFKDYSSESNLALNLHWMKLKQSGYLFPPTWCLKLNFYTIIIQLWAAVGSY